MAHLICINKLFHIGQLKNFIKISNIATKTINRFDELSLRLSLMWT